MTANQINYQTMLERKRNDQAIEAETNRHNQAVEAYNAGLLANQAYANAETQRHNLAMETLQQTQTELSKIQTYYEAAYKMGNLDVSRYRAEEEARSNRANELIKTRINEINWQSTVWDYDMARQRNLLQLQSIEEAERHNRAVEEEAVRSALVRERQQWWEVGRKVVGDVIQNVAPWVMKASAGLIG